MDDVHKTLDNNDADLNNFFSRPIKISTIDWQVGSTFGETINPWQLYFENLRVINRITNYNVLRAKLCVRIIINGNGFHYGRALASYRPLHGDDGMIAWRFGVVPQDIIGASQRMHVWIDPTKSQGGSLCLPYVYYKNAMNIPDQDWREMGELDIASVTTLEHANGGTDGVTISVFAWAEDVSLSIPTVAEPGALSPQSWLPQANEADEASRGPISGPAAAIAKVAGKLTSVPTIGKYAMATEMAAGATGKIARLFGMSRPVDTGPIQTYKPAYVGNIANSNTLDTCTKLTFDVKQELTIDPAAVGLGSGDEMAISSVACRESYLTQFPWRTTAVPESLLWNAYVTPLTFDTYSPTSRFLEDEEYHYTPMAWVAKPFENWRGTIKYRFQVVASSFHKGRLKIVYDPYYNGTTEYNTQITHIVDLAHSRDFTIEVGWGQEFSYLDHADNQFSGPPFDTSLLSASRHGEANGILAVYVVNDLTTPSADLSDVSVLVSVCAGDDFEVVNPNEQNIRRVVVWKPPPPAEAAAPLAKRWQEQADLSSGDVDLTTEETKPIGTDVDKTMAKPLEMSNNAQKIYFGDPVTSIRQILKRYSIHKTWGYLDKSGDEGTMVQLNTSNFPQFQGHDPDGTDFAVAPNGSATRYTYAETSALQWFTIPFLARRGGLRYKYVHSAPRATGPMIVRRNAENGVVGYSQTKFASRDLESKSHLARSLNRILPAAWTGSHCTVVNKNPTLEVEFPYTSNLRFSPARKKTTMKAGDPFSQSHSLVYPLTDEEGEAYVAAFTAVGEDFSLAFFQSCPVFWEPDVPTPAAPIG